MLLSVKIKSRLLFSELRCNHSRLWWGGLCDRHRCPACPELLLLPWHQLTFRPMTLVYSVFIKDKVTAVSVGTFLCIFKIIESTLLRLCILPAFAYTIECFFWSCRLWTVWAKLSVYLLCNLSVKIVEVITWAGLVCIIPMNRHIAAVKMIHSLWPVCWPHKFFDTVSLADVNKQFNQRIVLNIVYSVWVVCIWRNLNGNRPVVIWCRWSALATVLFLNIHSYSAVIADTVVWACLLVHCERLSRGFQQSTVRLRSELKLYQSCDCDWCSCSVRFLCSLLICCLCMTFSHPPFHFCGVIVQVHS